MVDGVKLMAKIYDVQKFFLRMDIDTVMEWEGKYKRRTGEILSKDTCTYRDLTFVVRESESKLHHILTIYGSIQKFRIGESKTVEVLTMQGLQKAIIELSDILGIEAENINVQHMEISCTAKIDILVKDFLNCVISQYRPFKQTKEDTDFNKKYKGISITRDSYVFKIYDKGLDVMRKNSDQIRVEVKITESKLIRDKYQVRTLNDLAQAEKVKPLFEFIEHQIHDTIIVDKCIMDNMASPKIDPKIKHWINPKFWINLDKSNRYKNRVKFEEIIVILGIGTLKENVLETLKNTWSFLMICTAEKSDLFGNPNKKKQQIKSDQFGSTIRSSELVAKNNLEKNKYDILEVVGNSGKSEVKNECLERFCEVCKIDISMKNKRSKYCSKKCNNSLNGARRKDTQKRSRTDEQNYLYQIENGEILIAMIFQISRSDNGTMNRKKIDLTKIHQRTTAEKRTVTKIEIITKTEINKTSITLTTLRAKRLMRWLVVKNNSKNQNYQNHVKEK
jgi:hypothetical protein